MELNDYQNQAVSTALYPHDQNITYLALALCGEAGEMADRDFVLNIIGINNR